MSTTVIKAKCLACSLHFEAFSDYSTWRPEFCPECGTKGQFLVWREKSDKFIFQHVPGDAGKPQIGGHNA